MRSERGRSFSTDAEAAVVEASEGFSPNPDLVIAFASTKQNPEEVHAALGRRFPNAVLLGCTTTGESLDGGHSNGSLTLAGLHTPNTRWASRRIAPLSTFSPRLAEEAVRGCASDLGIDVTTVDPTQVVAVLLCDGLSLKEERVAEAVAEALEGIPLAGGSAGDDLAFRRTLVLSREGVSSDAAVLLLGYGPVGFYKLLKHQHFTKRPACLAVTRADTSIRRVYEIDGIPAAHAYARALGLPADGLTQEATFLNPVLVNIEGNLYVRSVQAIHEDGSLTFYCAVDEGWLLDIAGHDEMVPALESDVAALEIGGERPAFLLGFNCILRALEADRKGIHSDLGDVLARCAEGCVSFDTYGEILNGLHINQTLVALSLGRNA